jgi:K+-sensing histidine kinase KdpD
MSQESIEQKASRQFGIMRDVAIAASSGVSTSEIAEIALKGAARLVGLSATTLILWDEKEIPLLTVTHSELDAERKMLLKLEDELFANLRKNRKLVSAYMSFGGEKPLAGFTLPLRQGNKIIGAVIGMQPGSGTLVGEDVFLEALTAALSVATIASGLGVSGEDINARIKKERLNAIIETATTVNHEINNPLTAVLGNIQLLLMKRGDLDEEMKKKLKVVEESALRIKEVTQKLMNITQDRVTDYTDGVKMIDLSDEDNPS